MKRILFFAKALLLTSFCFAQQQTENYIHKQMIKVSGVYSENDLKNVSSDNILQEVSYFDELGKLKQHIKIKQSPDKYDVVEMYDYDKAGRLIKKYFPYIGKSNIGEYRSSAISEVMTFYSQSSYKTFCGTNYPYEEYVYENSALNQVREKYAGGDSWFKGSDHGVISSVQTNSAQEVYLYEITGISGGSVSLLSRRYFASGELVKKAIKDENGNTTTDYMNKSGQIVLHRVHIENNAFLETYYVYNDFGLLSLVIPPNGQDYINKTATTSIVLINEELSKYIYQYIYDENKRMILKKLPGVEAVYLVYTRKDELVLSQNGNQRKKNQWTFYKYDVNGRMIQHGIYLNPMNLKHDNLQQMLASDNYPLFETFSTSTLMYSNTAFPDINQCIPLTINYYDSYAFTSKTFTNVGYGNSPNLLIKGYPTGSRKYIEDLDMWLENIIFYDDKYRPIQVRSENHLGGEDITSTKFHFDGTIEKELTTHTSSCIKSKQTVENFYTYDHSGRLLSSNQKINNGAEIMINKNNYNEIGQLSEKNLHSEDKGNSFLQSIDYTYNSLGWLSKINEPDLSGSDYDLFGMKLYYDTKIDAITNTNPQFNGNISCTEWKISGQLQKGYAYSYDKANRLTEAVYAEYSGGWAKNELYSVKNLTYDKSGNILGVERFGKDLSTTFGKIDELSYFYSGNQVIAVNDNATYYSGQDFSDQGQIYSSGDPYEYFYDANGNMTQDYNKGINSISYNTINLPVEIDFDAGNTLNYTYDPQGTKLRKEHFQNGMVVGSMDYCGIFIYENNTLSYLLFTEGRITFDSGQAAVYEYHLTDHLGNVRLAFVKGRNGTPKIIQSQDYYPFGMTFNSNSTSSGNAYLYNGKEKQQETGWLDYGARMYDPQLGRWWVVDAMGEKYYNWSLYVYAINCPSRFTDIGGYGPIDRVKAAKKMIGTQYKQETTSSLRTGHNSQATQYMDCAEFVCRVLYEDGITSNVDYMTTSSLKTFLNNDKLFINSMTPKVGDIALWEGHVGIVTSVDDKNNIKLTHARGKDKLAAENTYHIRPSEYKNSTFYGYYRPINEQESNGNNIQKHDENNLIYYCKTLQEFVFSVRQNISNDQINDKGYSTVPEIPLNLLLEKR